MAEDTKEKWINMGDINYLAYGGCLVKPHFTEKERSENLKYIFDVFYLNPEYGENGNQNFAALCCVDLTDSWLHWDDMLRACGYDDHIGLSFTDLIKKLSPEIMAREIVEYEGVNNFSPVVVKEDKVIQYPADWTDFIVSDSDLKEWLIDIGAEEFI